VYSADAVRGYPVAGRVRSGSVTVNGSIVDYKMPLGGFKQSGIGREGGVEGLENNFEVKTVYLRSFNLCVLYQTVVGYSPKSRQAWRSSSMDSSAIR